MHSPRTAKSHTTYCCPFHLPAAKAQTEIYACDLKHHCHISHWLLDALVVSLWNLNLIGWVQIHSLLHFHRTVWPTYYIMNTFSPPYHFSIYLNLIQSPWRRTQHTKILQSTAKDLGLLWYDTLLLDKWFLTLLRIIYGAWIISVKQFKNCMTAWRYHDPFKCQERLANTTASYLGPAPSETPLWVTPISTVSHDIHLNCTSQYSANSCFEKLLIYIVPQANSPWSIEYI
jgi:hypothetical protein